MAADAVKTTWVREPWSGCQELHAQCRSLQRHRMPHLPDHLGFPRRRFRQIEYGISGVAVWAGQSSSGIGGFNGSHRDRHHPLLVGLGTFLSSQSSPDGGVIWTGGMIVGAIVAFSGFRSLSRR